MARLFLETSALVKLYRDEPESAIVAALLSSNDLALIAAVSPLEIHSAFHGMVRSGLILASDTASYVERFASDLPQYEVLPINAESLGVATGLIDLHAVSHNLRPMDAIQLASAVAAHADEPLDAIISTDKALRNVAIENGLTVLPESP